MTGEPFAVPTNFGERYISFEFDLSLPGARHALQFLPQVGGAHVHGMRLYRKNEDAAVTNGAASEQLLLHPDSTLIAAWAPGAGAWDMPPGVGVDLGSGKLLLEVHYSSPAASSVTDTSGFDVCATGELRPTVAELFWLGGIFPGNIPAHSEYEGSKHCSPSPEQAIQVWSWLPRMRSRGTRMQTEVVLAGGDTRTVFDVDFRYGSQVILELPLSLGPGDALRTHCTFVNPTDQPIPWDEGLSGEVCYDHVLASPPGSLVSEVQGLHVNSCE